MNETTLKKIKFFLKLYWIRILVVSLLSTIAVLFVILIFNGLRAWNQAEPFLKESQLAVAPLQIFMQIVMGLIFATTYVYLFVFVLYRRGQGFTQVKKKAVKGSSVGITWRDVIGMDAAKEEATEVVRLIKDRAQLTRIGGQILKGILMIGPPGCGKTYLAKAMATEADMPFITMSGSEFVEMFVGVGASRIRKLFSQARSLAELEGGCIVFIDEIDAVGAQRATDKGLGGQSEFNTTVNQLLVEMDGLKEKESNVIVIGATNAPEDFLDEALLRPGRFDRKIYVGKPGLEDREKLFSYYLHSIVCDATIDAQQLARRAVGKTPADIANIVKEAALITIRNKKEKVSIKEISEAMDRIELGIKSNIKLSKKEKELTAYHEAGHALATYYLHPTDDVFKASIIPRKSILGAVYHTAREEIYSSSKERILAEIKVALGGYAAEKIKFNTTSDGVLSDFKKAMYLAHNMVWNLGMGESGLVGAYEMIDAASGNWSRAKTGSFISEQLKQQLNTETQNILQKCLGDVTELFQRQREMLDKLAQELIRKEELDYDDIIAVFNEAKK
ncbi:MAG: AAA family ATPase [Candidatus Gygaella obscura]|nr:AAA family ATPase [Candidatus Gygaella obscura]